MQREQIGRCEWCGMVDHHLVRGECERCRVRTSAPARTPKLIFRTGRGVFAIQRRRAARAV